MTQKTAGKCTVHVTRTFEKSIGGGRKQPTRLSDHVDESEEIEVGVFQTVPAQVSVPISITHNLGNYESAKVGVVVTVPCYVEELEEAFEFAKAVAEKKSEEMSDFSDSYRRFMTGWRRGEFHGKG